MSDPQTPPSKRQRLNLDSSPTHISWSVNTTVPSPQKLPDRAIRRVPCVDKPGDPDEPCQTKDMQHMLRAVNADGHNGLAESIVTIARRRNLEDRLNGKSPTSWLKVMNDSDSGENRLMGLLAQVHIDVLRSLVCNTLMADFYAGNAAVKAFVYRSMARFGGMLRGAGIYTMFMYRPPSPAGAAYPELYPGRYLTAAEIREQERDIRRYLSDPQRAFNIDNSLPSKAPPDRRWKSDKFTPFLQRTRELFLTNQQGSHPFLRCPPYVGQSYRLEPRFKDHRASPGSPIFGLVSTRLRNFARMELAQVVVFRIASFDQPLMDLGEIALSILMSSYWTDGGLNGTYAGGGITAMKSDFCPDLIYNRHYLNSLQRTMDRQLRRLAIYEGEHSRRVYDELMQKEREAKETGEKLLEARRDRERLFAENKQLRREIRGKIEIVDELVGLEELVDRASLSAEREAKESQERFKKSLARIE